PIRRSELMTRAAGAICLGLLALPLGLAGSAPAPAPKPAEERNAFFKDGKVVYLKIEIDKKETDSLRKEPRKYVKCTLKEGETEYKDAGIHLKGAVGSFRPFDDKPGLTLNMNKFAEDQLYRGM